MATIGTKKKHLYMSLHRRCWGCSLDRKGRLRSREADVIAFVGHYCQLSTTHFRATPPSYPSHSLYTFLSSLHVTFDLFQYRNIFLFCQSTQFSAKLDQSIGFAMSVSYDVMSSGLSMKIWMYERINVLRSTLHVDEGKWKDVKNVWSHKHCAASSQRTSPCMRV